MKIIKFYFFPIIILLLACSNNQNEVKEKANINKKNESFEIILGTDDCLDTWDFDYVKEINAIFAKNEKQSTSMGRGYYKINLDDPLNWIPMGKIGQGTGELNHPINLVKCFENMVFVMDVRNIKVFDFEGRFLFQATNNLKIIKDFFFNGGVLITTHFFQLGDYSSKHLFKKFVIENDKFVEKKSYFEVSKFTEFTKKYGYNKKENNQLNFGFIDTDKVVVSSPNSLTFFLLSLKDESFVPMQFLKSKNCVNKREKTTLYIFGPLVYNGNIYFSEHIKKNGYWKYLIHEYNFTGKLMRKIEMPIEESLNILDINGVAAQSFAFKNSGELIVKEIIFNKSDEIDHRLISYKF